MCLNMDSLHWCVLLASLLGFALGDLHVYTRPSLKVLPDYDGRLNSFTFLTCIIEPKNATVDSRWLLPSGEIVSSGNASRTGRLAVNEGEIALSEESLFGTVLIIENVSYKDNGMYTCEVREINKEQCDCEEEWPAVTAAELRLQVSLRAVGEAVRAKDTDNMVELRCETTDFIRPDTDLQWYYEDERVTNNRTSVTFIDGSPHTAQRGGNDTAPGRVSVLRIWSPAVTDTGMYTCRVQGTKESASVQLIVEAGEPNTTDSPISTSPLSSSCSRVAAIAASVTFVCATTLTAITTATVILLRRRKDKLPCKAVSKDADIRNVYCTSTVVGNSLAECDDSSSTCSNV